MRSPAPAHPGQLIIDGEACAAASGRRFEVHYPATGEVLTDCAEGGAEDIHRAVAAARRAQPAWAATAPRERAALLHALAARVAAEAEPLAQLLTAEVGKPIREARGGPSYAAEVLQYFAEWADKVYGETCPVDSGHLNYTLREPLGVVGAITAWNFPMSLAAWKLGPALALGNTVVLKPAEQAPLTTLRIGELALEVGFPAGVLNVVPGFGEAAGAALAAHPGVDKISFTGNHVTAQAIVRASAVNLKKLTLECGGKSPHVVFPDADMDAALDAVFDGIYFNQGQVCNAGSRLFLHADIEQTFLERLAERVRAIRLGDPLDEATQMGPVVSREQQQRVLGYIEGGLADGARALVGGGPSPLAEGGGYYVQPTLLTEVQPAMKVAQDEIFGPVLVSQRFQDEAELIEKANDTIFGLAAGLWTRDLSRAHRVAAALQAGTVWVNCYDQWALSSPFGGYKLSGIGKELGRHALEAYTQTKSVWVRL